MLDVGFPLSLRDVTDLLHARNAGALYLIIAVCGGFSIGYVPSQIIVAGDAVTTAANLMDQLSLFRLGVLVHSAVILPEIAITTVLSHVSQRSAPALPLSRGYPVWE